MQNKTASAKTTRSGQVDQNLPAAKHLQQVMQCQFPSLINAQGVVTSLASYVRVWLHLFHTFSEMLVCVTTAPAAHCMETGKKVWNFAAMSQTHSDRFGQAPQ